MAWFLYGFLYGLIVIFPKLYFNFIHLNIPDVSKQFFFLTPDGSELIFIFTFFCVGIFFFDKITTFRHYTDVVSTHECYIKYS